MTKSSTAPYSKLHDSSVMTSRAHYAITALLKIYHFKGDNPVSLAMISEEEDISISYLEQLFSGLRKHQIVKSYRGPGGGYVLAKAPKDIRIGDVMLAAEDCAPAKRPKKGADKKTGSNANCSTALLWGKLNTFVLDLANNITLDEVANCDTSIPKALEKASKKA